MRRQAPSGIRPQEDAACDLRDLPAFDARLRVRRQLHDVRRLPHDRRRFGRRGFDAFAALHLGDRPGAPARTHGVAQPVRHLFGAGAGLRFEPSAGRCRRRGQLAVDAGRDGRALRAVSRLPAVRARKSPVAGHEPLRRQGVQGAEPHQRPGDGPRRAGRNPLFGGTRRRRDVPRAFQGEDVQTAADRHHALGIPAGDGHQRDDVLRPRRIQIDGHGQ